MGASIRPVSHKPSNFPYLKHSSDSDRNGDLGGPTVQLKAGATLLLGDAVFVSAADTVNKSITAADHNKLVGIVVGGAKLHNYVLTQENKYGVMTAAVLNEVVIVQTKGVAWVITEAAYAAGTNLIASTTTAGRMLTAGAARGVAVLLEASTGPGDVARALLF